MIINFDKLPINDICNIYIYILSTVCFRYLMYIRYIKYGSLRLVGRTHTGSYIKTPGCHGVEGQ